MAEETSYNAVATLCVAAHTYSPLSTHLIASGSCACFVLCSQHWHIALRVCTSVCSLISVQLIHLRVATYVICRKAHSTTIFLCSEEWRWLKSLSSSSLPQTPKTSPTHVPGSDSSYNSSPSHSSLQSPVSLQQALLPAVDMFLHNLGINKDEAERHQLYCHEAIELNEDITLLLVMPPHEQICTPPGSSDHFAKLPNFVPLPINTFEISKCNWFILNLEEVV